jgi:hypothetical protein
MHHGGVGARPDQGDDEMNRAFGSVLALAGGLVAFTPAEAKADIVWTLHNVVFDDGGEVLNGTFTVNVYGYLKDSAISITTTQGTMTNMTGGPLNGDLYNADLVAGNINNSGNGLPDDIVTFFSSTLGYLGTLNLEFKYALSTPRAVNPIIGGEGGPSWECAIGFDCPDVGYLGTPIRYTGTDGFGAGVVPEPSSWALLIVGFAGVGFAGYRRAKIALAPA